MSSGTVVFLSIKGQLNSECIKRSRTIQASESRGQ